MFLYLYYVERNKQTQNIMRISNIANLANDRTYELTIIGTESEVENFGDFTSYTADFIEEELNDEYSITILSGTQSGNLDMNKKEFKANVTAELKEFRKTLK